MGKVKNETSCCGRCDEHSDECGPENYIAEDPKTVRISIQNPDTACICPCLKHGQEVDAKAYVSGSMLVSCPHGGVFDLIPEEYFLMTKDKQP